MPDKPFKTHDEQILILESRGIDFSNPKSKGFAKSRLQHIGYYALINGYNKLFLSSKIPEDQYKPGTTIEEIHSLYCFDKELRSALLEHILSFETNIKTLIAYYFSESYGHENYMLMNNFDTNKQDAYTKITKVISDYHSQIASRSSDPSILHYLKTYGYIPLWVANNVLTFGQISKFYAIMKQQDRQKISKVFHLQDSELENILYYLSSVRNFCAHGDRMYCYRSKKPLINLKIHSQLSIPKLASGEYQYGKRDLFAAMIALKYVISNRAYKKLIKSIKNSCNKYAPKFSVISIDDVLSEMGFPQDWDTSLTT